MTSSSPLSPSQTTQPQGFGAVEQPIAESRSVYVPLNVHSQYSILNSTASVSLLAKTAKRFKMPAIAITDDGNLYGVVDFYKACRSQGVKPIIGCEMWMAPSSRFEKKTNARAFEWNAHCALSERLCGLSTSLQAVVYWFFRGVLLPAAY